MQDIIKQLESELITYTNSIDTKKLQLSVFRSLNAEIQGMEEKKEALEIAIRRLVEFNNSNTDIVPLKGTENAWGDVS